MFGPINLINFNSASFAKAPGSVNVLSLTGSHMICGLHI